MGEKVFFLSGRDRCAQVYQHECKIYKHVCKTNGGAAMQKSAKSAKSAKCTHALQAWCIHHHHLPSPFSRFNLFMSDASLLPGVYTALETYGDLLRSNTIWDKPAVFEDLLKSTVFEDLFKSNTVWDKPAGLWCCDWVVCLSNAWEPESLILIWTHLELLIWKCAQLKTCDCVVCRISA